LWWYGSCRGIFPDLHRVEFSIEAAGVPVADWLAPVAAASNRTAALIRRQIQPAGVKVRL
jgi:hypothetical protein